MNGQPDPTAVPPPIGIPRPRPTIGGILRDSLGAVQRFIVMAAEEATDHALRRVQRAVLSILIALGMGIAALTAYVVLLHEMIAVLSELGVHPLWRLLALLLLLVLPLGWLIWSARALSSRSPRRRPTP